MRVTGRFAALVTLGIVSAVGCSSTDSESAVGALLELPADGPTTTTTPTTEPAIATPPAPSTTWAAPTTTQATTPPDVDLDVVAVVGDSLALSAVGEIEAEFARIGIDRVVVDARESRRMTAGSGDLPSGRSAIGRILGDLRPDLWVIALGTNDVSSGADLEGFRDDVDEILAALPDDVPIVWVDIWIRDRRAEVVEANLELREALTGREAPSAVVAWYSAAAAPGNVIRDGVHLTEEGRTRFAGEIASAIVRLTADDRDGAVR